HEPRREDESKRSRRFQFLRRSGKCRRLAMIATVSRRLGAVGFVLATGLVHAHAAEASAWDGDARSAVRIIAGAPTRPDGKTLRAGVEIRLAPGWKTYWRYPGDSGVPPRFDFAQSSNVQSATLHWPSPHRFGDA